MAQSVKYPTLAQVVILQSVGSSPTSGSVLTAQSLEPAADSVSPSLSDPPPLHSLSLSKVNTHLKKNFRGAWVAQSVERPTSAQIMISWFVGLSPMSGSALTVQNLIEIHSFIHSFIHFLSLSPPQKISIF